MVGGTNLSPQDKAIDRWLPRSVAWLQDEGVFCGMATSECPSRTASKWSGQSETVVVVKKKKQLSSTLAHVASNIIPPILVGPRHRRIVAVVLPPRRGPPPSPASRLPSSSPASDCLPRVSWRELTSLATSRVRVGPAPCWCLFFFFTVVKTKDMWGLVFTHLTMSTPAAARRTSRSGCGSEYKHP
jgi:hypothetical protein